MAVKDSKNEEPPNQWPRVKMIVMKYYGIGFFGSFLVFFSVIGVITGQSRSQIEGHLWGPVYKFGQSEKDINM